MWLLLAAGLVVALVLAAYWWQGKQKLPDTIAIPGGSYPVAAASRGQAEQMVPLVAFAIDRTEVTNQAYRRCYEQRECPWPSAKGSASHSNYFLDPAFNQHPVTNVDWDGARRYCAFVGGRLPTASEWEVAASYAPATQRRYRYPWGDQFQLQRANGGATATGDTRVVGSYHPVGNSPLGAADMAGNVAEWTATPREEGDGDSAQVAVMGGSFRDRPEQLLAAAWQWVPADTTADWLGFRCAADTLGVGAGR